MVDARKHNVAKKDLFEVFRDARRVIAVRGQQKVEFDFQRAKPPLDELAAVVLGRTATLRAPTIALGGTYVVGFNEAVWRELLGAK